MSITASCHCGNIKLIVEALPDYLGDCSCSICRRYAVLWGYYSPEQVTIAAPDDGIDSYIWGDEMLNFQRCKNCGCITHYLCIEKYSEIYPGEEVIAINFRMLEPSLYKDIFIKKLDGANKWN